MVVGFWTDMTLKEFHTQRRRGSGGTPSGGGPRYPSASSGAGASIAKPSGASCSTANSNSKRLVGGLQ